MYRTPIQESRYKQRTHDRGSRDKTRRYEERRESSEYSTSDEDEESTDRYTEESEDTTESRHGREHCEWNAAASSFNRERIFSRPERPEDILLRAYFAKERLQKCDKVTQKNFLSPFPSFLIPPVYREVAGPPNYRYTTVNNPREGRDTVTNSGKLPRSSPRKMASYEEEPAGTRSPNRDRKLCDKHKVHREIKHFSKSYRPERILTCVPGESSMDPSSLLSKKAYDAEGFPRHSPRAESGRKPKSVSREDKPDEAPVNTCKDCLQCMENRRKANRSGGDGANQAGNATKELLTGKRSPHGAPGNSGPGKVREKLVYVVEEEGKDVTKLETDLFSVNEILTIKKDLLELSEFAKKLKKLKEMKRDAEKGKADKSACQCKPLAELLKNVNKRIEALEARQEELERGSHKTSQKGDAETVSKKTSDPKTSSNSPPKTPVVRKQSAMTTVPSFPKTEMIVSRAGFSNNSEIVNELMDIKTQLKKLEKRRMSKEFTPEAAPLGYSKLTKKKDHAIAVFSSRTYILTSKNYEKTKHQIPVKEEVKAKTYLEAARSRTDQTKETVAKWLKSVSPIGEGTQNEIAMLFEGEQFPGKINKNSCVHACNGDGFQNQGPHKNRASEAQPEKQGGRPFNSDDPMKIAPLTGTSKRKPNPHLTCKECVMTPSGRLFVKMSSDGFPNNLPGGRKCASKGLPPLHAAVVRRSASSCSVSSPIVTKERSGRLKKFLRNSPQFLASHSKSTQELNGNSSGCRHQKIVRNPNVESLKSPPPRDKVHKESKNEFVKRRDSNLIALKDFGGGDDLLSSSSFSELIRTVNLDTEKPSESIEGQDDGNMHIYSLATMTKLNFKGFDMKEDAIARERARERERERERERKREEEAAKEAAKREENQIPGSSKRKEQCLPRPAELAAEKDKVKKAEGDTYECECCCKKKSKAYPSAGTQTGSGTSHTEGSSVTSGRDRKGQCEERRKSSSERRNRRHRDRGKLKIRRRRSSSKANRKQKTGKECSKERVKKKKSKDSLRKSRSKERPRRKKSKESPKPKKILSKSHICCRQNRLFCSCQAQRKSSSCGTESLASSCRQIDPSCSQLKPLISPQPKTKSQDSLELYLRRQKAKSQIEKEKLTDDSCMFRSLFKNLRRLYPKFNLSGGTLCPTANMSGDQVCRKLVQQHQLQRKESEYLVDLTSEEDDDSDVCCNRSLHRHSSHNMRGRQHWQHYRHHSASPHHYCHDDSRHRESKQEHIQNCKCVRVYLQTQGGQGWPGALPFRGLSSESTDGRASSAESRTTLKSDFIFPGRLPDTHYVGHSSEKKRRKKRHPEKEHKKRKTHQRRHHKIHRHRSLCVCDKCGNVHKRHRQRGEKVTYDDSVAKSKTEAVKDTHEVKPQPEDMNKPPSDHMHFPMFSFLKYFCRNRPHSVTKKTKSKSRSSLLHKMSEVRHLKMCASVKKQKLGKKDWKHIKKSVSGSIGSHTSCQCAPKLTQIEDRLAALERTRQSQAHPHHQKRRKRRNRHHSDDEEVDFSDSKKRRHKTKKKKKRKKKKKKYCECFDSSHSDPAEYDVKKKKKRKRKKRCECPENFSNIVPPTQAQTYYCTCPASDKTTETTETNESQATKTTTTTTATTTTATTGTTATTEDTESSTLSRLNDLPKRDWKLKQRLSSLQCLLSNFQRYRKTKPQPNNSTNIFVIKEPDFIDDCSRSSPMPRTRVIQELKPEPSGFLKRIKKLRRKKCKKKKKTDKKEKVKEAKEKRNPKSMTRVKRHK